MQRYFSYICAGGLKKLDLTKMGKKAILKTPQIKMDEMAILKNTIYIERDFY